LELQKQLRHLQAQFDLLSGQASALIQGRRARVAATSTVNGCLAAVDDTLSARNLRVYNLFFYFLKMYLTSSTAMIIGVLSLSLV
jgi:hypothetical protein